MYLFKCRSLVSLRLRLHASLGSVCFHVRHVLCLYYLCVLVPTRILASSRAGLLFSWLRISVHRQGRRGLAAPLPPPSTVLALLPSARGSLLRSPQPS